MTEFASLRDALDALRDAQQDYARTVERFVAATEARLETHEHVADDLRDDLYVVANRVESLFRAAAVHDGDTAA